MQSLILMFRKSCTKISMLFLSTYGEGSVIESIISISLEEIRVTTINDRGIKIIWDTFPVWDQFWIGVLHGWFLSRVKSPEFGSLVEVNLAVSGPNSHSVDIIWNSCKTFADFLRVISVHSLAYVSPIFRALHQHNLFLSLRFIYGLFLPYLFIYILILFLSWCDLETYLYHCMYNLDG